MVQGLTAPIPDRGLTAVLISLEILRDMEDYKHMCAHPGCYNTEDSGTIYKVQSRRGNVPFKVCGNHLLPRDIDRAKVVSDGAASELNAEILSGLKQD